MGRIKGDTATRDRLRMFSHKPKGNPKPPARVEKHHPGHRVNVLGTTLGGKMDSQGSNRNRGKAAGTDRQLSQEASPWLGGRSRDPGKGLFFDA